ncbi:MAG: hypothetical protein D6685_07780 [Bacteroidetes bacterium]|nr:MAG: hypothetical protein D6685_07780 [Bacteroidota bacterium]
MNTEHVTPMEQLRRAVAKFTYLIPYLLVFGLVGIGLAFAIEYWRASTYETDFLVGWFIGPMGMWVFAFILYLISRHKKEQRA